MLTGGVEDFGITDANNMGAAMAPAAFKTIKTHLSDYSRRVEDYDRIITGDLGIFGSDMLYELLRGEGSISPSLMVEHAPYRPMNGARISRAAKPEEII